MRPTAQLDESAADRVNGPVGIVSRDIGNLHHGLTAPQTAVSSAGAFPMWGFCQKLRERRRHAAERGRTSQLAIKGPQNAERRLAEAHRLVEHRVEHRREVAGRAVDDLQDLGGRGLLL